MKEVIYIYKPKSLFKYRPFSEYSIKSLKNAELWFSKPECLNDPFDFSILFDESSITFENVRDFIGYKLQVPFNQDYYNNKREEIIEISRKIIKEINEENIKTRGVTCFSEVNDDLLMWAHYADSFKGFCLEFDTENSFFEKCYKVKYSLERPKIGIDSIGKDKKYIEALCTKSGIWSYEKEWRAIHQNANQLYGYGAKCLKSIYFGPKMDFTAKEIICLIIQGNCKHVNFYESSLDEEKYRINFNRIDYTRYIDRNDV